MNNNLIVLVGVLILLSASMSMCFGEEEDKDTEKKDDDKKDPRTLKVNVVYNGSGVVDSNHIIGVLVFNRAEFIGDEQLYGDSLTSSNGTVTFSNITFSPCYVFLFYNADGSEGEPNNGDSYEVYEDKDLNQLPATPITIEEGGTKNISITFDDTIIINFR